MELAHLTTRRCNDCGETFPLTHKYFSRTKGSKNWHIASVCRQCKYTAERLRQERKREGQHYTRGYTCVEEPEFTGYLNRHFPKGTFREMLKDGLVAPGTVWRKEDTGYKYRVVGNEAQHVYYEMFDEDAKPQKLRRVR